MAAAATEDYSKRQRIINAVAVYPDRYDFDAGVIAELTDASESYVYRLLGQMDDTDIEDSQFADDLADDLQDDYRDEIEALLDDQEVERGIDNGDNGSDDSSEQERVEEEQGDSVEEVVGAQDGGPESGDEYSSDEQEREQANESEVMTGEITVQQVREIRTQLERHREDAEFGRKNFHGPSADVAHGKYYVANEAITLLDQVLDDAEKA